MKIRVLFVISTMGAGGAERQVALILKYLNRERFEPHLYLIERSGELLELVPADVPISVYAERHPSPRLNFPGRIHRSQVADLAQLLRDDQVDVLYERMYFATMIGGAAARHIPVPRLAVIDSNPRYDLPATAGKFVGWKKRLLRRYYLEAAKTLGVSAGVRQQALDYYRLPADKIETCYNFLDLEHIRLLSQQQTADLEVGRFHVVAIGRMQAEKGFDLLIDASAQLIKRQGRTNLLVHLFGEGPLAGELKSRAAGQGITEHVCFHGYVKNLYPVLRSAQLFCLPSRYEGLPTVLLEAMTCGIPVLAADCDCGPREILDGGRLGRLVPVNDSGALAKAIEAAMENTSMCQDVVTAAREHVERQYSLEAGIARLESVLESVARRAK